MKVLFYIFKNFYQFFENSIQCVLLIFTSLPHLSLHLPLSSPPIQLYVLFLLFTHQDQFVMLKYSRIRGLQVEHGHLTRAYNLIRENWLSQQLPTTNHSPARGRIVCPTPFPCWNLVCFGLALVLCMHSAAVSSFLRFWHKQGQRLLLPVLPHVMPSKKLLFFSSTSSKRRKKCTMVSSIPHGMKCDVGV